MKPSGMLAVPDLKVSLGGCGGGGVSDWVGCVRYLVGCERHLLYFPPIVLSRCGACLSVRPAVGVVVQSAGNFKLTLERLLLLFRPLGRDASIETTLRKPY
jgi:hypothetical protein